MNYIEVNLASIKDEIVKTCVRAGRDPGEVRLVAVSKMFPVEMIMTAYLSGQHIFGENRVQELINKKPLLPEKIEWHLIGTLQRNKVKYVVGNVALIHSLDSLLLAQEINKCVQKQDLPAQQVLLQVNVAGETSKSGFNRKELFDCIKEISCLKRIKIKGLMTIAPIARDSEEVRPVFRELKILAQEINNMGIPGISMQELSMGMSDDFKVAIEEGATLVRIGSRLFGSRIYDREEK